MDPNTHTYRHQSRLRREMYANRNNPFHSPPSSTGSHGTVSTTTTVDLTNQNNSLSTFSFSPDGEGTRKFGERQKKPTAAARSGRFGPKPSTVINTSALARAFPEWGSLASTLPTQEVDVLPFDEEAKENYSPLEGAAELKQQRKRTRAEMQPRVDAASDRSSAVSEDNERPAKPTRRSRFTLAPVDANVLVAAPTHEPARPPSKSDLLVSRIRAAQAANERKASSHQPMSGGQAVSSPFANRSGLGGATGRSFLLPSMPKNIFDWTSGTLRFSTMRDGVPVFVKHGRAHSRFEQQAEQHDTIEAIDISPEDQEIFISMDKLRDEVKELQDHDEMVQAEAEKLQAEVDQLQAELKRLRTRRGSDSAIGSDSEHSINRALDAQRDKYDEKIAQLQSRLEDASRQVGVHDIHGAALTAERDEALHQASAARERAKTLQTELESLRRDLDAALEYRHGKDALEWEKASLRKQHDTVAASNKTLTTQQAKLRRDLDATRLELATVREELQGLRAEHEELRREKALLAQDHAGLERSNEAYYKENKTLLAKVGSQEQRIRDLERGLANRDRVIDEMGATEPEDEVEALRQRLQKLEAEMREKSAALDAARLSAETLGEENVGLVHEVELLRAERRKTGPVSDHNEDECARRLRQKEVAFAQRESTLTQHIQRQEAAITRAKQLTREISGLSLTAATSSRAVSGASSSKAARMVPPISNEKYAESEQTSASDGLGAPEDPTTRIDLTTTQGSDYASIFSDGEIPRLQETLRYLQQKKQKQRPSDSAGNNTVQTNQTLDSDLPPLPPVMRRTRSDETVSGPKQGPSKPVGILKKTRGQEEELTGRFSVKSGVSLASVPSINKTQTGTQASVQEAGSRPASRLHHRRSQSDGQNETSAFFVPDITLHSDENGTADQTRPSLSKDARRVLDGVCRHTSRNCTVCSRITAHGGRRVSAESDESARRKKSVWVQRPVPVTDRDMAPEYEDEPTMRPDVPPGHALAFVIKQTEDDMAHLEAELLKQNRAYCALDKALGQRQRRRAMAQIQLVQRQLESKSAVLYRLHDVLEGQKAAGQAMTEEEVEMTIASICGESTKDETWNGCSEGL